MGTCLGVTGQLITKRQRPVWVDYGLGGKKEHFLSSLELDASCNGEPVLRAEKRSGGSRVLD